MSLKSFNISTWDEILSCYSTTDSISERKMLLLHGAGQSDKNRLIGISHWLSQHGIESVGFDFSWHGASTKNTIWSIKKRVLEAEHIIKTCFVPEHKIMICAFSMSGQVTYELLRIFGDRIEKCFLCAPALYHRDAIDTDFGPNFSTILRTPKSYQNHNVSDILAKYSGDITIIIWSEDNVIPPDVPDIIIKSHTGWENKKIVIPSAPHMLAGWTMESEKNMETFCQIVLQEI